MVFFFAFVFDEIVIVNFTGYFIAVLSFLHADSQHDTCDWIFIERFQFFPIEQF